MNAYNNTKHSATGFAPNDIKKEDIDTIRKNIKKQSRVKKYEDINEGDSVRLQLKEKTFRKESDPTFGTELHQVELNNHDGVYIVDGVPHSRKDLQLVRGRVVIPKKKLTAVHLKADKIGKAAYNPVLKDLMGSSKTLERVDAMINEPMKQRGKQILLSIFCYRMQKKNI